MDNPVENIDLAYIQKNAQEELQVLGGHTLLFTGASGFLGYYFIKSIQTWNVEHPKEKIRLHALDLFPGEIPSWLNSRDVAILKSDVAEFKPGARDRYDYIVHAASIASPIFYRQYPIETINANVQGLYNILDYMVSRKKTKKPVRGLLFFSTSEIYGDPTPENIPTPETYRGNVSCTGPRACYDESKRFGETLCVNYAQVHQLPIKIVRPFNNYGPGLKIADGRAVPDFSRNILRNEDIVLLSQGSPTRTFCYVADAVVGYLKALVRGRSAEAYNIGIERPEISIADLARLMQHIAAKEFGYTGKIVMKKSGDRHYLTDNPNRRCPVIKKAKKELGFSPKITLQQGLRNSLLWYKHQHTS